MEEHAEKEVDLDRVKELELEIKLAQIEKEVEESFPSLGIRYGVIFFVWLVGAVVMTPVLLWLRVHWLGIVMLSLIPPAAALALQIRREK